MDRETEIERARHGEQQNYRRLAAVEVSSWRPGDLCQECVAVGLDSGQYCSCDRCAFHPGDACVRFLRSSVGV